MSLYWGVAFFKSDDNQRTRWAIDAVLYRTCHKHEQIQYIYIYAFIYIYIYMYIYISREIERQFIISPSPSLSIDIGMLPCDEAYTDAMALRFSPLSVFFRFGWGCMVVGDNIVGQTPSSS